MSIRYEHETSLEGRCAVIRSPDPVLSLHPCHQSGEDQNPGATHRFCECCPSRRHEHDFEQHLCSAGQDLAERGKMKERAIMLLNRASLDAAFAFSLHFGRRRCRASEPER